MSTPFESKRSQVRQFGLSISQLPLPTRVKLHPSEFQETVRGDEQEQATARNDMNVSF